jgi:hypothetical protein
VGYKVKMRGPREGRGQPLLDNTHTWSKRCDFLHMQHVLWYSSVGMQGVLVLHAVCSHSHSGCLVGCCCCCCSWHTYKLLVYMHEVPDLDSKGGIRRLDRYDQLAQYILGKHRHGGGGAEKGVGKGSGGA